MNKLLDDIVKANGHYCHALEVSSVYEIETVIEVVIETYPDHTESTYIDFFETMEIYALDDENESDIYSFSFAEYIKDTFYF